MYHQMNKQRCTATYIYRTLWFPESGICSSNLLLKSVGHKAMLEVWTANPCVQVSTWLCQWLKNSWSNFPSRDVVFFFPMKIWSNLISPESLNRSILTWLLGGLGLEILSYGSMPDPSLFVVSAAASDGAASRRDFESSRDHNTSEIQVRRHNGGFWTTPPGIFCA